MDLFLIDGIGPFFRELPPGRINWSKIPFSHLESGGALIEERWARIRADFRDFCRRVASVGFNTVTLDDVAHLVDEDVYPDFLRRKIAAYCAEYRALFLIAREAGLDVFVTTDVVYLNAWLEPRIRRSPEAAAEHLAGALEKLFGAFPEVRGVILRIGESDGRDVRGDFRSEIIIRTPLHARLLLQRLLPVAERHGRLLIFRTWSVGAYRIGDLIWNRETFDETFAGLDSAALVLSMKYGESDFFRYLPLNRHFFRSAHRKIVELQARREYEGCGEYPAFIGGDYAAYRDALRTAPNMAGIMVWCQTGGWTPFRRLSYLDPAAVWNEINTEVAIALFRHGVSMEGAVRAVFSRRYGPGRWDLFLEFLVLSERVIKQLLYLREFACRKLFFRRLRVPPLLTVYWDQVLITSYIRKILRSLVLDQARALAEADAALADLDRMIALCGPLGLPADDLRRQRDLFRLLHEVRRFCFEPFSEENCARLNRSVAEYRAAPGAAYTVHLDLGPLRISRRRMRRILAILLRDTRGYRRLLDHVLTLRLLSWLRPALRFARFRALPDFAHDRAMGVDTVLR